MTPALKVVSPGLHTTVQGLPRLGYRDIGVPSSGPLDRVSQRLANALVGNPDGTAGLEMLVQGPTFEVLADSVRIALVGCSGSIEIRTGDASVIPAGQSVVLPQGTVFRIGSLVDSVCAYLAIEGGLDLEPTLGSVSTYVRGGFGGFRGRRLQKGDVLPLKVLSARAREEYALPQPLDLALNEPLRVVLGPQADHFSENGVATFLSSVYKVSPHADRMGFRLDGPTIEHAHDYNIVSDGVVPGSIQVPGSGLPIILMADSQTTGGYPKIATVISADLPHAGRRRPGAPIRFAAVGVREAELLRRAQEAAIADDIANLRVVAPAVH